MMGSPKKSYDMTKDFVTHYTSDENDKMVVRLNNGVRSNKYKDVDYDKLKLLAAEKKFSAHKSLLKVKKIEQISKQSKENNLMKQHKLVWHKEFIRLNNLKKRVHSEVELHKRQNVADGSICSSVYQNFEDYEAGLDVDFGKFKLNTGDPVWELREDLQFWLQENLSDLKMGVPEVVEKHAEIRSTINSVKQQQKQILEKLRKEQQTLEAELGMGELGDMIHEEMDHSIHIVQGIPEEAFDLECQDFDLKVNVLQEFIVMDEKFRERLHYLEDQHSLILSKGRHGGWSEEDHFLFISVYEQYPHEMMNRRKLIIDMLQRHLPHKSRAQLVSHEDWCDSNKYFRERKRALMVGWQKGRAQLYLKAKSVFMEADIAAELEEVKIEYLRRQKQVRQALYEKVRKWRDQQLEAMLIQQRLEESRREALREQLKKEAEMEKKRRAAEKEKISVFHDHQMKQRQEQEERDRERLEELNRAMAEQAKFDKERAEQIQRKIEERKKMQDDKEEEEREKEERLEALREKVRVIAESDPERMMKGTKAWESRLSENFDDINLQKPLFDVHTFTSSQVTSDQRVKVEQKLREAGLHNSEYARHVISKVPPPNPPRRDMESTVFKYD